MKKKRRLKAYLEILASMRTTAFLAGLSAVHSLLAVDKKVLQFKCFH